MSSPLTPAAPRAAPETSASRTVPINEPPMSTTRPIEMALNAEPGRMVPLLELHACVVHHAAPQCDLRRYSGEAFSRCAAGGLLSVPLVLFGRFLYLHPFR